MAGNNLINLVNEIDPNGLNATIFVSGEMASAYRLGITLQPCPTTSLPSMEITLYIGNFGETNHHL